MTQGRLYTSFVVEGHILCPRERRNVGLIPTTILLVAAVGYEMIKMFASNHVAQYL